MIENWRLTTAFFVAYTRARTRKKTLIMVSLLFIISQSVKITIFVSSIYLLMKKSKAQEKREAKLAKLANQSELKADGKERHICRDGLPSLSHGRPKGCYNPYKEHNGETLTITKSFAITRTEEAFLNAKAYIKGVSISEVIRYCIDQTQRQELNSGIDSIRIYHDSRY